MMSFAPGLKRLAAAFFCAAVILPLCAAEPELPPSKRNAPKGQQIEFSPASTPQVPKPTIAKDALEQRRPMAPETSSGARFETGLTPSVIPRVAPSRAATERMKQDLDKKRNWLVPGAQDDFLGLGESWATKGLESTDTLDPKAEKKSVLERFLTGDTKSKTDRPNKRNEDKNGQDDNYDLRPGSGNDKSPNNLDRDRDPREDANGVSDFNLHGFLSGNDRRNDGSRKEPDGVKAFQPIRSDIGGDQNRAVRERDRERDRENTRVSEFQQMIAPRGGGPGRGGAIPDPINSGPDLTRREMNPILPRAMEPARPETTPFNPPVAPPRFQDRGMLGVTTPGLPAFGGPASSPIPSPSINIRPAQSIILEPPKRKFN